MKKFQKFIENFLGDTDLDFPRFFRFFNDRLIVTEEFACSVKIFIVEGGLKVTNKINTKLSIWKPESLGKVLRFFGQIRPEDKIFSGSKTYFRK